MTDCNLLAQTGREDFKLDGFWGAADHPWFLILELLTSFAHVRAFRVLTEQTSARLRYFIPARRLKLTVAGNNDLRTWKGISEN
jgi:hypothetical protein